MLTSTGRAVARRVLSARGAPKLAQRLVARRSVLSVQPFRTFSVSRWVRSPETADAVKKPAAKKPATKKAKKPAPKKVVKKKKKVAKKPQPVKKKKKVLSPEQKAAQLRKILRIASLRAEEPAHGATTGFNAFIQSTKAPIGPESHREWKNLSASQVEEYNNLAIASRAKGQEAYQAWVKTYPVEAIHTANLARTRIRSLKLIKSRTVRNLQDARLPVRPVNAYARFYKSQYEGGMLGSGAVKELVKVAAQAWKNLSPSEKKIYTDAAEAETQLYQKEMADLRAKVKAYREDKGLLW